MLKIIQALFLTLLFCFSVQAKNELEFSNHYESEHFQIFFEKPSSLEANELLGLLECQYKKLSIDFEYNLEKIVKVNIFPDITSFQVAIGKSNAPDSLVASRCSGGFYMVSPHNPGSYHTKETMFKVAVVNLAQLFLAEKFDQSIPYWLVIGTAYFEADMPRERIKGQILESLKNNESFPTLSELTVYNSEIFFNKGGFRYALTLVDFIYSKWGWKAILGLMKDIHSFDTILGISQEEFREQWIRYLHGLLI